MHRLEINARKRIRRKANDFVNKRMKLDTIESSSSNVATPTFSSSRNEMSADCNNLLLNEISSSNSSDCNEDIEIKREIASWVVNTGTPALHVDSLLRILQKKIMGLPTTCKTLLRTPKNAYEKITPMCSGYYLHVGLQHMLETFLSKHKIKSRKIIMDVGIDGTPSTNSSDTELWPIMVNVVGYNEVLLIGCYFGPGKPKDDDESSNEFLTPFVTEVSEILNEGGITYEGQVYELEFRAFVMDAPARAFIMNTILYTGYHSCTKCVIVGKRIANRMVFHGSGHKLRSNFSFRNRIHSNHHHSNDITMIEKLPIDCIKNVPIESMHNVFIGVSKQLFTLWIHDRKKAYSIPPKKIKLLSHRIFAIAKQLPSEFSRTPRILKHLKRYKATEFRQFTLYTLIIILKDILPLNYYNHFLKFHCAIRILSTPNDCIKNSDLASELLTDFVKEFGVLYGYHNLSYNVHCLLHLSQDVSHFKCPLDDYSAFKFENFLQYLKKLCRNNFRVLEQINNRFSEKFFVSDYKGDFMKRNKENRTDKSGNFTDIHIYNMHLSVKSPNNYVLTDTDCIFKITKILPTDNGTFDIQGTRVKNICPLYEKPIQSNFLNIFTADNEITSKKNTTVRVTEKFHKIAKVQLDGKCFYLSLLH